VWAINSAALGILEGMGMSPRFAERLRPERLAIKFRNGVRCPVGKLAATPGSRASAGH
jgi:hypothetical protein